MVVLCVVCGRRSQLHVRVLHRRRDATASVNSTSLRFRWDYTGYLGTLCSFTIKPSQSIKFNSCAPNKDKHLWIEDRKTLRHCCGDVNDYNT